MDSRLKRTGMTCLFSALIIFYFSIFSAFAALTENESLEQTLSNSVAQFRELTQSRRVYQSLPRRDPMQPLIDEQGNITHSAEISDGLLLQGVFVSGGTRMVLIDDRFYSEGNTVGAYKILEIKPNGFLAQKENEKPTFFPIHSQPEGPESPKSD